MSVGDYVKSISLGTSPRMYHIRVDSVCLPEPGTFRYENGVPKINLRWYPVSVPGTVTHPPYARWNENTGFTLQLYQPNNGDTIILGASETGEVKMVNAGFFL